MDRGWLHIDDKPLRWPREKLPITVWLGVELSDAWLDAWASAAACIEDAVVPGGRDKSQGFRAGRLFSAVRESDQALPLSGHISDCIHVETYWEVQRLGEAAQRCQTELRHDNRTGEILSVLISVPDEWTASEDKRRLAMLHELCHALGLGHDDDDPASVMHHAISGDEVLRPADALRLRSVYA